MITRRGILAVMLWLALPATAGAQMYYRPQPAPYVTAENESWFQLGEPITFEGHFYYPAGARVFFNGNTMVRTGSYRGVPLYADATIEPYSIVLVPLTGGLLQPYERRRTGDLAGGTGSRAPSFPVTIAGEGPADRSIRTETPMAPAPPAWNVAPELTFQREMEDAAAASAERSAGRAPAGVAGARGTASPVPPAAPPRDVIQAGFKPKGLNEIYVNYKGFRWRAAGMAVPIAAERYVQVGERMGFPVYAERSAGPDARRIFLPTRPGLVAPFERAGRAVEY